MKYFELVADKDISNPMQIQKVDELTYKNGISEEEFDTISALVVGYFDNLPQIEIYDVLQTPAFLISDPLKRLFALFEPDMKFKGIQLFANDLEDSHAPLYWMPYITPVECISKETKKYTTGMLERLVLDMNVPITHDIFRVADIFEHKIIVSLSVAESMIRRKMSGITFVPVVFSGRGGSHEER